MSSPGGGGGDGAAAPLLALYVWMYTICVHNQHVSAYITRGLPTLDVIINILLTKGENAVVYNRRDVEKKEEEKSMTTFSIFSFPFFFFCKLQHLQLAQDQMLKHLTVILPPSESLLERHTHTHARTQAHNTHTRTCMRFLFLQNTGCCHTSQQDVSLCVCSLMMCEKVLFSVPCVFVH